MPSILIKGMKMPKSCDECQFCDDDGMCAALQIDLLGDGEELENSWYIPEGYKSDRCPLMEIPDHGDLIDKEDLMASLADWQLSEAPEEGQNWWLGKDVTSHELQYSIYRLLGDVYKEVRDEPVIIPAERIEE